MLSQAVGLQSTWSFADTEGVLGCVDRVFLKGRSIILLCLFKAELAQALTAKPSRLSTRVSHQPTGAGEATRLSYWLPRNVGHSIRYKMEVAQSATVA